MAGVLRVIARVALRILGVTAMVYAVLYATPGSLKMRVISGEDARVIRRSDVEQTAKAGQLVFSGDRVAAGGQVVILGYESEPDVTVRVEPGEELRVGNLSGIPLGYWRWLRRAGRGDLGHYRGTAVTERLMGHAPRTLLLVGGSLLISLVAALGMALAGLLWARSAAIAFLIRVVEMVSGLHVIVLSFAVIGLNWAQPNIGFSIWLLVILAVGNGTIVDYHAIVRQQIGEALGRDYVEAARGRGANPLRHAMRFEIALGLLEATSSRVPALVGGTIIVEWVFSYLGLGYDIVRAIQDRDFELIMGVTAVVASVLIALVELTEATRQQLDPRLTCS